MVSALPGRVLMCAPLAMPEVGVDWSVLAELEFEPTRRCEWIVLWARTKEVAEECDAEATWSFVFPCCGHEMVLCDKHVESMRLAIVTPRAVQHTVCKAIIGSDPMITRLKGKGNV